MRWELKLMGKFAVGRGNEKWFIRTAFLESRLLLEVLKQWYPILGPQIFLDYNSQKSWPAQLVVKASGSFNPRTSGDPRLGTTILDHNPENKRSYGKVLKNIQSHAYTMRSHRLKPISKSQPE